MARCLTSFLLSLVTASGRETRCFTGLYLPKGPAKGQDSGSQKQLASQAAVNQVSGTPRNTQGKLYKGQPSTQKNQGEQRILVPSKSFQWLRLPKGKAFSVLGSWLRVYRCWITQMVLNGLFCMFTSWHTKKLKIWFDLSLHIILKTFLYYWPWLNNFQICWVEINIIGKIAQKNGARVMEYSIYISVFQ